MDFHSDHVAGDSMVRSHLRHCKEIDNGPRWCTCDGTMETLTLGAGSPPISMQQSRSPTMLACSATVGNSLLRQTLCRPAGENVLEEQFGPIWAQHLRRTLNGVLEARSESDDFFPILACIANVSWSLAIWRKWNLWRKGNRLDMWIDLVLNRPKICTWSCALFVQGTKTARNWTFAKKRQKQMKNTAN